VIKYAETNMRPFTKGTPNGWDIIEVPSMSNPNKKYRVDVTNGRCSCPAWIFQRGGERKPCKHLLKWGFRQVYFKPGEIKEPQKVVDKITETVKVNVKSGA